MWMLVLWWLSNKESACQGSKHKRCRFHSQFRGRCPGVGNGSPLQYSCLEYSMDRRTWWVQSIGLQRVGHDWVWMHALVRSDGVDIDLSCPLPVINHCVSQSQHVASLDPVSSSIRWTGLSPEVFPPWLIVWFELGGIHPLYMCCSGMLWYLFWTKWVSVKINIC